MAYGVFIHRSDSIYDDSPAEQYQFPSRYLGRVQACVGDWIVYYEPRKVPGTRGYFAVAKVAEVLPDPHVPNMFLALIEPGTYLDFANTVPFVGANGVIERGLVGSHGRVSARAQWAVRPISSSDFVDIVNLGLDQPDDVLPRTGSLPLEVDEEQTPFDLGSVRERVSYLMSRAVRDRVFRQLILNAYDQRCAVTGLKLINGGGRAEVEAAHIRPVQAGGPDIVSNGLALSGTAHWMFDRGLIGLADDLTILVSRQVNDANGVHGIINKTGRAIAPLRPVDRPHPGFLQWHRQFCFKQ